MIINRGATAVRTMGEIVMATAASADGFVVIRALGHVRGIGQK